MNYTVVALFQPFAALFAVCFMGSPQGLELSCASESPINPGASRAPHFGTFQRPLRGCCSGGFIYHPIGVVRLSPPILSTCAMAVLDMPKCLAIPR